MKNFLLKILVGVIFFLTICIGIEFSLPYIINNQYSYKYNYAKKHKDDIKILLMGNSHFENSINPSLVSDSTFDMAVSARWIYYDRELVKHFVPQMSNLKVVMYPMGYMIPFLSSHHYNPNKAPYIDYVHQKYMHVWYDRFPENIFRWLSIIHGNKDIMSFVRTYHDDWIGDFPLEGHCSDNWREQQNVVPDTIFTEDAKLQIAEYTEYLIDMAAVCADNGVRFIVVTPPCHESYNVNTRPEGIETLHKMIEDVRAQYPIEYIDYLQDDEFRADSLYYNCSHLNVAGADLFALRVKEDFGL